MMGPQQVEQGALFYEFSLDDHVPPDYLLRSVDLPELRQELAPFYSATVRPSVDPELMIRILIAGYRRRGRKWLMLTNRYRRHAECRPLAVPTQ